MCFDNSSYAFTTVFEKILVGVSTVYSPSQSFFARFRLVLSDALIMTSLIVEFILTFTLVKFYLIF